LSGRRNLRLEKIAISIMLFIDLRDEAGKRSDIVFRKSKEKATRLGAGRSLKGFPASGLPANVEADRDTDS
jgi:hypothetical protein